MSKSIIFTLLVLFSSVTQASVIHPYLTERLPIVADDEMIKIIVHLKNQPDLSILPRDLSKEEKILFLKKYAQAEQANLLNDLTILSDDISDIQTYWIFNGLSLNVTKRAILSIAAHNDVDYVIHDFTIFTDLNKRNQENDLLVPGWNIKKIHADSCWNRGFNGAGIVIGNIDTGVDTTHPALSGKYFPGGWFDAVNNRPYPYDDNGHGTFMMGVICGGDGNGPGVDDIGVAPGARYICAKALDSGGGGTATALHACLQWFATQRARVVNNPWSESADTSREFWNDCLNLNNLGILPVFRIGSLGPQSRSTMPPGNFPICTGVGATDSSDYVYSVSSRGPAPNRYPWNDTTYWMRRDWNLIKPDITAPGVNIRSSVRGGGYSVMSGTSPATSHVTGAIAILLQRDSTINIKTLYQIILDNADHPSQGAPYPNNNYGWGRLNVYKALQSVAIANKETKDRIAAGLQVYPNPFRDKVYIRFTAQGIQGKDFSLNIYDVSGRRVKGIIPLAGKNGLTNQLNWNGLDDLGRFLPQGIYLIVLDTQGYREIKKVMLIRD